MLDKMSADSSTHPNSASVQKEKPQCGTEDRDERHCSAICVSDNPMPVRLSNISSVKATDCSIANKSISIQRSNPEALPDESDSSSNADIVKIGNQSNGDVHSGSPDDDAVDEPDHVQHRSSHSNRIDTSWDCSQRTRLSNKEASNGAGTLLVSSYPNDSSAMSSPSQSTTSTPVSTPTRYVVQPAHSHKNCCQHKSSQKFDARLAPSPYRQLLPIALCIISFATVFSILIVYMDTTEIRHQQFRLNMSRDDELYGVAQDDPTLVAFLREIHMRKYPMHFHKNRDTLATEQHHNFSARSGNDLTPEMAHYVASLVGGKMNGAAIQSLTGTLANLMTAPWLSDTLNWAGVIVEPEPRRYFTVRKQNAYNNRLQIVHACVSNNPYPKEITIHNEDLEVKINSLRDEETFGFNSRVKCFPLYTLMLACDRVEYDHLSLGVHGYELEILQTLPFDKVKIEIISIHLTDDHQDLNGYIQSITKFLVRKSYKLQKRFGRNYFYQRMNATNRTRKKDVLLLKTP